MAHFAEINESNVVVRVVVVDDAYEADGENWCASFFGGGLWKQTSYNNRIRYNFAGVGYTYDPTADAFYAPQPYPSWTLDENFRWQPPVEYPGGDIQYSWDEASRAWVEIEIAND
jgi:hypothetical protein